MVRRDPTAAPIDRRAVGEQLGPDPAADPVARLDTTTERPAWLSRRAAVNPAYPAPTTQTSASMRPPGPATSRDRIRIVDRCPAPALAPRVADVTA